MLFKSFFYLAKNFYPKFTFKIKSLIVAVKHTEASCLGPLKTSPRNRIIVSGMLASGFWIRMISVCQTKSWCWAVLKMCLLLQIHLRNHLNILAAVHSGFWSALKITIITALLCSLVCLCWSYWFWLLLALHIRNNLLFLVKHAIRILNGNLLASKAIKNRCQSSSNNYIWWMKFVWYLTLSV